MEAQIGAEEPKYRALVCDEAGCSVCGITVSSSFRNCTETHGRVCNSCHCKQYRLKRKLGHLASGRSGANKQGDWSRRANIDMSPASALLSRSHSQGSSDLDVQLTAAQLRAAAQLLQQQQAAALSSYNLMGHHPYAAAEQQQQQQQQAAAVASWQQGGGQQQLMAPPPGSEEQQAAPELQRRVVAEAGGSRSDWALTLACARRAQQATPGGHSHRVVLGVLPSVKLQLPDDPPGLLHAISCLVEAVVSHQQQGGEEEAVEQGGDSQEQPLPPPPPPQQGAAGAARVAPTVAVRLTVFAAAGAVACWHEAPASLELPLAFSPLTKAPIWTSGPGGFSLQFPHPFCPQVDMFAATHRHVALAGPAVLQRPTLSLSVSSSAGGGGGGWEAAGGGAPAHQPTYSQLLGHVLVAPDHLAAASQGAMLPPQQQQQQQYNHHPDGHHSPLGGREQPPQACLDPTQLSFGPLPSGPLLSSGDMPGLSIFDL